ncbi:succinate dehydrogenase [Petrotoga mexicana DSM 14811]|uniref:Succinate dehydrogenase n=1 Tax=Petrotoga mexicana DSM 14811 TaxID=1122954 RepID=A0A2K1P9J0_9BACT|nr:FAD-binding protein [Petrotoga mexicana]PNR99459.1 succinate dehydrogenase [Petrotoga mexicana DSM 14811]
MKKIKADVIVVGAGGAGLRAALSVKETNKDLNVKVITKGERLKDSITATSYSDRMAFHATLDTTEPGTEDSWKYHADDIFKIGGMVSDKILAEVLAKNSKDAFEYLDKLGVPFVKENGKVKQFRTDGSQYARACFTGPDTAVQIAQILSKEADKQKIEVIENVMFQDILLDEENKVKGAWGINTITNEYFFFETPSIILACGGPGQVYSESLYPKEATGDCHAAALRCGAELVNMEFIQIGLSSKKTKIACSGSFMRSLPKITNNLGEDVILKYYKNKYDPKKLISILFSKGWSWPLSYDEESHIIDVAVAKEILDGRKIFLDYTFNPEFFSKGSIPEEIINWYKQEINVNLFDQKFYSNPLKRLKSINKEVCELLKTKGLDIDTEKKIEIFPAIQHFQGGIKINERAETNIKGLYACGEAAGGQHGANRPGGNSLLDTQVFGKIAGQNAALYSSQVNISELSDEEMKNLQIENAKFSDETGKKNIIREEIRTLMSENASVIRSEKKLLETFDVISNISNKEILNSSKNLKDYLETCNIRLLSRVLLKSMCERKESRGPHLLFKNPETLELYPRDDENWAYRYIVVKLENDNISCSIRKCR